MLETKFSLRRKNFYSSPETDSPYHHLSFPGCLVHQPVPMTAHLAAEPHKDGRTVLGDNLPVGKKPVNTAVFTP